MLTVSERVLTPGDGTAPTRWPQRLGSSASEAIAAANAAAAPAARIPVSGLGTVVSRMNDSTGPQASSLTTASTYSSIGSQGWITSAPVVMLQTWALEIAIAAPRAPVMPPGASKQMPPSVP